MRLQEFTTSLTRSQLGVCAGDTTVRFRGNSSSCFTACEINSKILICTTEKVHIWNCNHLLRIMRVSTCSRAQSSLMSHSGLSWLASMAGLASEGNGLAKGTCCFREKFFFWSFPSLRTFNMLAFSKRERGGMTDSPWPFFFFLAAAGKICNKL